MHASIVYETTPVHQSPANGGGRSRKFRPLISVHSLVCSCATRTANFLNRSTAPMIGVEFAQDTRACDLRKALEE